MSAAPQSAHQAAKHLLDEQRRVKQKLSSPRLSAKERARLQTRYEQYGQAYEYALQKETARIVEADRAQAAQRTRAGAVGARSEAVKQQEARDIAATQGQALGTVQTDGKVLTSSSSKITTTEPQVIIKETRKPTGKAYSIEIKETLPFREEASIKQTPQIRKPSDSSYLVLPGGVYSYEKPVEYYGPEGKPTTDLANVMENTLGRFESFQKKIAFTPYEPIVGGVTGLGKAAIATSAYFYNLGLTLSGLTKKREPKLRFIDIPETGANVLIESVIAGKGPKQAGAEIASYVRQHGIISTQGEYAEVVFGVPGVKTVVKPIARILPIKLVKPTVAAAGEVIPISKSLVLGYGSKTINLITKYSTGGIKIGKYDPVLASKVIATPAKLGPTGKSSFEVLPLADYTKAELKQIRPTLNVLENQGIIKPGKVEQAIQEGEVIKKTIKSKPISKQLKKEYKKTRAGQDLTELHPGLKSKLTLLKLAQAQKKYVSEIKGSDVFKQLQRFPFAKGFKRGDIDTTTPTMDKGIKGANLIVTAGAEEPYALTRIGTNVGIGKKGEPVWDLQEFINFEKGKTVHGTNLSNVKSIEQGIELEKGRRNLFFTTQNKKVVKTFQKKAVGKEGGKPAVAGIEVDQGKILFFKNIPKRDRGAIASDDWQQFQDNLISYAKERGFKGATKPYHSLDVKAPKYEMIIFDKSAIIGAKNIPPTRYLVKDAQKIINIVNPEDELKNVAKLEPKEKFYGAKYPNDKFKQNIEGTRKKLTVIGLKQQTVDLNRSISGVVSRTALKEGGLSDKQLDTILGKYEVTTGPLGHRYEKDIMRGYLASWKLAQTAFKVGKKDIAKDIGIQMGKRVKEEPSINWRNNLQGLLKETNDVVIDIPSSPKNIPSSNIITSSYATSKTIPSTIPTQTPETKLDSKIQPSKNKITKSVYSNLKSPYSAIKTSSAYRSLYRQTSTKSSYSSSNVKSPKSVLSGSSAKPPSSIQSPLSAKSTGSVDSPGSPLSPGSPFSPGSPGSPGSSGSPSKSGSSPTSILRMSRPATRLPISRERRPVIIGWKTEHQKRIDKGNAKIYPFIANVPLEELVGVYGKRTETVYGKKKVKEFEKFDIKETKKRNNPWWKPRKKKRKPGLNKKNRAFRI